MAEVPLTIADAAAALRAGELTSVALTEACYAMADRLDAELGTYITRYDETALAAAAVADEELAAGIDKGPLHGIPIGIKDIIACREGQTTANSVVFDADWYAGADAPVVARLRAAGAVITGKVTTMEYAIGLPDATKPYPIPRNPWDTARWPGGSSSGSGSGVAAGLFLGALGTDTGGSVRMPAAFCGITGMKQTYGLVPKAGCLPLGVTLDHIGPMTRSAADAAAMLSVMAGFDPADPSMPPGVEGGDYAAALTGDLSGLRIGVDRVHHLGMAGADPDLETRLDAAVADLEAAGATVVEVELPLFEEMMTACMLTMCVEAFSFHQRWMQTRWSDYGFGMRSFVGIGATYTAADYAQAQKVRRIGAAKLAELLGTVDLLAMPTTAAGAPVLDGISVESFLGIIFTQYWNPVGCPTIAVPMGLGRSGLPLSLSIAGKPFADALVLRAADAFQRRSAHHLLTPSVFEAVSA
ncbi:MAG: amidase [Acidimicrobiales bacterium]|nr:amidase [Acidimicrobiales bacterium]